jgi:hypothetical protein
MIALWAQIVSIWAVTFLVLRRARSAERSMPLDNLPVVFLLMLTLYATLPPLLWLIQGGEYRSILSGRLFSWQPTLGEQWYLTLLALLVAVGVAISQLCLPRRFLRTRHEDVRLVPTRIVVVCVALLAVQFVFVTALQVTGTIRTSGSYIDSYLVIQELPLALRQILKMLGGLAFVSKIVTLVWLFQHWRTHKVWVYAFVLFTIVTVDPHGGRASAAISLFACVILWNRYVRPITMAQLAVMGMIGLAVFTALGAYRGLIDTTLAGVGLMDVGFGEFDSLWANAIELRRDMAGGVLQVPVGLYFSEFYGPIPSNLLPFDKLAYSQWYLDQYYPEYKSAGGGLMFGLLAQIVIGFGWIEALLRGFLLGLFLTWLTHVFGRGSRWWHYPALLYCAVFTFQSIRDSSFALVTPLIQALAFGIVTITVFAALLPLRAPVAAVSE